MVTKKQAQASQAFAAIADPTRRAILDLVRGRELRAGELADHFPVSRPAIAKHVAVLRRAGLLRERREATSRWYTLDPTALQAVDAWLAPYRLFWAARLTDLRRVVEDDVRKTSSDHNDRTRTR